MGFWGQLRRHGMTGRGDAIVKDGPALDWAGLLARVEREAAALQAAGLRAGMHVGITIPDEIEHFVASLALLRLGAWQVALATHDTAAEREAIAARAGVSHVLLGPQGEPAAVGPGALSWPLPAGDVAAPASDAGGVLLRTSGTTGTMNIVPLSGDALLVQAARHPEYAGGRLLRPASIEHNNSKRHRLYCAAMGGTNVFLPAGQVDLADYCRRLGVTALDLALMQAADLQGQPFDCEVRVSGSSVPHDLRQRLLATAAPKLVVRYGATEVGTIAVAGPAAHAGEGSVGRVVAGIELEIVDADGWALPHGESGQIRLRGEGIAAFYLDAPEQSAARFREGWFWPGDIGALAADGTLRVLGRADDMINLNGINIFPSEIERVLESHPEIGAAAALGLPSPVHGQIPVAAVELKPGRTALAQELQAFARERLALRAPRRILIVEALPRNSQGKIVRRELAAKFHILGSTR
ncbi:MAG: hypothetical protein EOP22_14075 [Hyphomicrobiales bacterium]|nr:MAG: hypothetical protein EOP22_14075 [Hyphomicrobiales bacterium]